MSHYEHWQNRNEGRANNINKNTATEKEPGNQRPILLQPANKLL